MAVVPVSARWLAGVGAGVFLLPVLVGCGFLGVYGCVAGLVCAVVCAVPPFFRDRDRDRFRVACAAVGMGVGVVSVVPVFLGLLVVVADDVWFLWLYLLFLSLPVTAVAALIAAFQRARGRECGRRAVLVAWVCAAVTVGGWGWVAVRMLMWAA